MYKYIYIYIHIYMHMYKYVYILREKGTERQIFILDSQWYQLKCSQHLLC